MKPKPASLQRVIRGTSLEPTQPYSVEVGQSSSGRLAEWLGWCAYVFVHMGDGVCVHMGDGVCVLIGDGVCVHLGDDCVFIRDVFTHGRWCVCVHVGDGVCVTWEMVCVCTPRGWGMYTHGRWCVCTRRGCVYTWEMVCVYT